MKIHHELQQGSTEWHEIRARNFTASELGPWVLDPVKITKTVDELKDLLDRCGISRKGLTKRDDLISCLEDPGSLLELCDGAKTAILKKITQEKHLLLSKRPVETMTLEEILWMDRQNDMKAKEEKSFEFNIPVQYGNQLEPYAREYYERATGYKVTEVGFIECDGYGCSPDGLIYHDEVIPHAGNVVVTDHKLSHGVEIKCPTPETHLAWLIAGELPEIHKLQVHASMVCAGVDKWDFLSYCPGDSPLLITVRRDEFTEQLEAGLKALVKEKAAMKSKLARLWAEWNDKSPDAGATE